MSRACCCGCCCPGLTAPLLLSLFQVVRYDEPTARLKPARHEVLTTVHSLAKRQLRFVRFGPDISTEISPAYSDR